MKVKSAEFSDCLPFLIITADHHITVLGKNLNEAEGSSSYREFSSLRYNSRPGDAGSFFARPTNETLSTYSLPCIPAILDTKNDRVYALQQGNNRLTCWNSWKSCGPDETSALKIHLEHPALSMTLLPMSKGIIYGSCQNGVIYIARVVGETISVEYLQVKQPKGTVHIGTFAEIEVEQAKTSGRKRKISDADGNSSVNFYQVLCDGSSIKILRNNVSLSISNSDKLIKSGSLIQNTASVGLLNDELSDYRGHHTLDRAELLISSSGSAPKISVIYTVSNTSTGASKKDKIQDRCCGTFCAAISLANGEISNSPVRLPSLSNQFGLVTETVLAAASSEMIYLYDLITGSTLQSKSLERVIRDMDGDSDWVLHTNDKHGILAIFFQKEDHLHVALSTAALDESNVNLSSNTLKSSSKLACSLLACPNENLFDGVSSTGADNNTNSSLVLIRLDESVSKALKTLEETRQVLISKNGESCSKTSFREAFDASISTLIKDISSSNQEIEVLGSTDSNPQDSCNGDLRIPTKRLKYGKLNGRSHSRSSIKTEGRKIPASIPQSFIDGSVQIVLSIILREMQDKNTSELGLDARHVLKDLIQSKRMSARFHFEGSYALQETGKKHPLSMALKHLGHPSVENPLSALQMILEMIVNCSDLSERHLVIMLDYMMRHAKADSIVDTVLKGHEKKTIIAGMKTVLTMIVGYSECNEAMLRVALVEELSSSTEAIILARILPKILMTNPHSNHVQHFVRAACQWIAALSESFRDDLRCAKTSSGENYLTLLLNSVEKIAKNSQAVMSLKDSIGVAEMINKHKKTSSRKVVSEAPQIEEMWGYSIDHIIF
jgi:hypothetical protein